MGTSASSHVAGMADLRAQLNGLDEKLSALNDARFWRQASHSVMRSPAQFSSYGALLACNPGMQSLLKCSCKYVY
jgi:hypothetical protein